MSTTIRRWRCDNCGLKTEYDKQVFRQLPDGWYAVRGIANELLAEVCSLQCLSEWAKEQADGETP